VGGGAHQQERGAVNHPFHDLHGTHHHPPCGVTDVRRPGRSQATIILNLCIDTMRYQ
jgi:hypothetical protein